MSDNGKRTVSAREIMSDIRSGMDELQLKRKYRLSHVALKSVCTKLAAAGLLTEGEIAKLRRSRNRRAEAPPTPRSSRWRCPACGARRRTEIDECPACGIIVKKFLERQEHESQASATLSISSSTPSKSWTIVACAVAAVLVLGIGLALWPKKATTDRKSAKEAVTGTKAKRATGTASRDLRGELFKLKYSEEGFPLGLSVSQGFGLHFFETPSADQGFRKLPPETGKKRYYDELSIAGGKYRVVTEATNPPKMYLDANGNGDLTDDPGPFSAQGPSLIPNHYSLLLPYKNGKSGVPYRMWLFSSRMGGVRFYPKCHWQGQLEINGKNYRMVLFDGNADGDYSNDPLVIDVDGDGKAGKGERLLPGDSLSVDGTRITLHAVAPSGRRVRLELQPYGIPGGS